MTPEQLAQFKQTAAQLQHLETRLCLAKSDKEKLVKAGDQARLYLKVEVFCGGTNQMINLSQGMIEKVYTRLLALVDEEIDTIERDIAYL